MLCLFFVSTSFVVGGGGWRVGGGEFREESGVDWFLESFVFRWHVMRRFVMYCFFLMSCYEVGVVWDGGTFTAWR